MIYAVMKTFIEYDGIEALFRDDSGNWFSLTQPKWLG